MKKILSYIFATSIFFALQTNTVSAQQLEGQISISGAFALYPLAVKWAAEFQKINPKVKINISAGGAGKGITDVLGNLVDIGMVSREIYPQEAKKNAYAIAVTKDAVVPTVSASHPDIKTILAIGLRRDAAYNIWVTGRYKTWNQLYGIKGTQKDLHIYTRSDACGAGDVWSKYFGKKQEDLLGVGVFGDPGIATAVQRDPYGIGYNNIAYAYDIRTKKPNPGIKVIPLDLNNNRKIDADENFYETLTDLLNAIASGKYPSPPARDLYFVTKGKPSNPIVIAFIKWVLTDGQKFVTESGYIHFSQEKLTSELKKIQ